MGSPVSKESARLFVDTCVFLRFYNASDQRLQVFQELKNFASHLVFTSQSRPEFERNRTSTLRMVGREFKKRRPNIEYGTTVLQAMPSWGSVISARENLNKAMDRVHAELQETLANPETDPVLSAFLDLIREPKATTIKIGDEMVHAGQRRKLLGNPPTSSDKHSIGDEVHWEAVLATLKGDLVIVTADSTYLDNMRLLCDEFAQRTKAKLTIVSQLTEGLHKIGEEAPAPIVEAEKKLDEGRILAAPGWTMGSVSGFIGVVHGRDGAAGIVPTADHPERESYRCPNCGFFGPWNGAICLSCGSRSFDD